jgi:hypothetical protein
MLFGFHMGFVYGACGAVLMSGYILYDTSNVSQAPKTQNTKHPIRHVECEPNPELADYAAARARRLCDPKPLTINLELADYAAARARRLCYCCD